MRAGWLPRSGAWDGAVVLALIGAGAVGLWGRLNEGLDSAGGRPAVPGELKWGAMLLYASGCAVYLEIKSLVARGYSLRILVDLLERGGQAELPSLKACYGGGLGVEGLLRKRLRTLADVGLVNMTGTHVGPLTAVGKGVAFIGLRLRQVLRLNRVG